MIYGRPLRAAPRVCRLLAPFYPPATPQGSVDAAPIVAPFAFSGLAPVANLTHSGSPGVAALFLAGRAPAANINRTALPGLGTAAWSGLVPTLPIGYTTLFPGSENPITEGGLWTNGLQVGGVWKNVQKTPGFAYAAAVSSGNDDALACLSGYLSDQSIEATIFLRAGFTPPATHEVELLTRFIIASSNARGYKASFAINGTVTIYRLGGPINDVTTLNSASLGRAFVTGDVVKFAATGTSIQVSVNGILLVSTTDATYSDGAPGMGFKVFTGTGVDPTGYCFSRIFALGRGSTVNRTPAQAAAIYAGLAPTVAVSGSSTYQAIFQDVLQQVQGGPVRTYGWRGWPNYDVTLLDTHTVVAASGTENWTVSGQNISVTVRDGRLREATTATLASIIQSVLPGDTILCRAGTYTGKYDANGWSGQLCLNAAESGTASQRIHITSYPGETATFQSTDVQFYPGRFSTAADCAHFWDVSALSLTCTASSNGANVYGGEQTANSNNPESGATDWRFVGNLCHITNTGANNVGQLEFGGDNWKVLGNRLTNNTARSFDNQAHSIYVDSGADNCEIAYNRFEQRREGFSVMFHQDGTPMAYTGNWVHHNYFDNYSTDTSSRGSISMSNIATASTVLVEDNWFRNCGAGPYNSDNFGPMICYSGTMTARRNLIDNPRERCQIDVYPGGNGQSRTMVVGSGVNRNWWGSAYQTGNSIQVAAATDGVGAYPNWMWVQGSGSTFTVEP